MIRHILSRIPSLARHRQVILLVNNQRRNTFCFHLLVVYYNKCSLSNINAVRVKHAYQLKRVSQSLTTPQRTCCTSPNPRSQPHLHSSHQILPILLDSEFLPRSPCGLPFCRVGGESLAPPAPPLRYSSGSLLSISSCMNQGVSL